VETNVRSRKSPGDHQALRVVLVLAFGALFGSAAVPAHGQLFVGLEGSTPTARSTDLSGFPDVSWSDRFAFDISGAAATPEGSLYLCNGAFTTKLYSSTITGPPAYLCTLDEDMFALAFGRGKLYGYSNYADPKGIYEIDPVTGSCSLVLDVYSENGFRFFALDYNPVDDLFYGYTTYGVSGLYSINIDSGEMIKLADPIPASNAQGLGLAVGRNTVYLTATRGDDGIPHYAYDLTQGAGGEWQPFTQPYPAYHSTGGAAYIPQPGLDISLAISGDCPGQVSARATSATPNGLVALVYAFGAGAVTIPGGPCAGTELGLDDSAQLSALVTADGSGSAELSDALPAAACQGRVVLQAIDVATCSVTQVVATP
jgi:hypothetical protein